MPARLAPASVRASRLDEGAIARRFLAIPLFGRDVGVPRFRRFPGGIEFSVV